MGVHGLTTLVRSIGLFPATSNDEEREEEVLLQEGNCNEVKIPPGSTFAIDGPGLVFYIYKIAYYQHYNETVELFQRQEKQQQRQDGNTNYQNYSDIRDLVRKWDKPKSTRIKNNEHFEDESHLITNLIPSLLSLHKIKSMTNKILDAFVLKHDLDLKIYLDGKLSRMKFHTKESRCEKILDETHNLRNFFQNNILPPSFLNNGWSKSTEGNGSKLQIPSAEVFLREFPIPLLLFDEVVHAMDLYAQNHEVHASSNRIVRIIQCKEEADRFVALQSATDLDNTTYAVGSDSDYMIYGFSAEIRDTMKTIGDPSVLYLPLDYLKWDNTRALTAVIVTRLQIATALGMGEDALMEASIVMGNDYTSPFFADKKCKTNTNFHTEIEVGGRLSSVDVVHHINSLGDSYKIESKNEMLQCSIDFTRDIYQFRDIKQYPFDIDIGSDADTEEGALNDDVDIDIDHYFGITDISFERSRIAVKSMLKTDKCRETLEKQVLASFHTFDQMTYDLLQNTMKRTSKITNGETQLGTKAIPTNVSWKNVLISTLFEKALSLTLRERRRLSIGGNSPSDLFDIISFFVGLDEGKSNDNIDDSKCDQARNLNESDSQPQSEKDGLGKELPIDAHKTHIIDTIQNNRVTIIQGETGSGKSSRVPVFCLEEENAKVVICQPRRIAAKSLADRIRATEPHLKDQVALRMGHGVRENENKNTRAWFMTTGYLVRYIANQAAFFDDISYIIIDEVHERSAETDILCLLAKRLLKSNLSIRLILMSATVAAETYVDYFDVTDPPVFVGGRCYPIKEYYIEDIGAKLSFSSRETKATHAIKDKCLKMKCKVAPNAHYMASIQNLAVQVAIAVAKERSSVLIFVPGMSDIVAIVEDIENIVRPGIKYKCIAIHSDVPFEEQMTAFDALNTGEIKIIVATNAAESSLTLPDVDHVICTGLCKEIVYNATTHRQMLTCNWISKASATQRKGRTGRVREGNVYRLYPRTMYENDMSPFEIGEMHRMPLDSIILNLRSIVKEQSVTDMLAECLEPPNMSTIEKSIESLHQSRFIDEVRDDFEITALGNLVTCLGVDLKMGALIGIGKKLDVLPECIAIAAFLSFPQSPWLIPNSLLQPPATFNSIVTKTIVSKSNFDSGLFSEAFAGMNLLIQYLECDKPFAFCNRFSLSHIRMRRLSSTYDNLRVRVASVLGCPTDSLKIKKTPMQLDAMTLKKLQLLQVWLFHDSIVQFNPKTLKSLKIDIDGTCTVPISGDSIEEKHFKTVLSEHHKFHITNMGHEVHNGHWIPINQEEYNEKDFSLDRVQEKILSLAIEKSLDLVCILYNDEIHVLLSRNMNEKRMGDVLVSCALEQVSNILCKPIQGNKRGRTTRDCGMWTSSTCDKDFDPKCVENSDKLFIKYMSISLKISSVFTKLRNLLKTLNSKSLCICLFKQKANKYPFNVYQYGGVSNFSKQVVADIFETTHDNVNISTLASHKKQLVNFSANEMGKYSMISCVPESVQIISGILSSQRSRNPVFRVEVDHKNGEEEPSIVECSIKIPQIQQRWTQLWNDGNVLIDGSNFVGSLIPTDSSIPVFACCANTLQLKGGTWMAEGLTVLPPQREFLMLALQCAGISGAIVECHDFSDKEIKVSLAEVFFSTFWSNFDDLDYCDMSSKLLTDIFSSEEYQCNTSIRTCDSQETQLQDRDDNVDCQSTSSSCQGIAISYKNNVKHNTVELAQGNGHIYHGHKYFCPHCNQHPFKWTYLKAHLKIMHGENLNGFEGKEHPYYVNKFQLTSSRKEPTKMKLIHFMKCRQCDMIYNPGKNGSKEIQNHIKKCHKRKTKKDVKKYIVNITMVNIGNSHYCESCSSCFDYEDDCIVHLSKCKATVDTNHTPIFDKELHHAKSDASVVNHTADCELNAPFSKDIDEAKIGKGDGNNVQASGKNKYFCPHCNEHSFKWRQLIAHFKHVHNEKLKGPIGKSSPYHESKLENSLQKKSTPVGFLEFHRCQVCGFLHKFGKQDSAPMKAHLQECHQQQGKSVMAKLVSKVTVVNIGNKHYYCDICGVEVDVRTGLKSAIYVHYLSQCHLLKSD